ncbi:hypothetical protein QQ054_07265 [Oscillatoria amoena NRMC-F 0135]|jgi:hypothetical protein|nr:hypothetical protein [Oscillatoria amoena NRMC-F 0135]
MKKPKAKKKVVKPTHKKGKQTDPIKSDEAGENPFDFGGLPDRDLKRNLGCG